MRSFLIVETQPRRQGGTAVLVVHVNGKLVKEDYENFVPEFDRLARGHGKLRVLFDMSGLHGW
nr:STAS/SEC14 domain-containing protein [Polaromonas sp.]